MAPRIEAWALEAFRRGSRPAQTGLLIVFAGLILLLALALDSGGDTAFMYSTF